jgi:hypothetical protein
MMGATFATTLAETSANYAVRILVGSVIVLFGVLFVASIIHHRYHYTKKAFFGVLGSIIVAATAGLLVVNIQLLASSENGGIERRSSYITFNVCDQQLHVLPNQILSSAAGNGRQRIYTDGRMEYVGNVTNPSGELALGPMIRAVGGTINSNVLTFPYPKELENEVSNSTTLAQFIRTNPVGERYLELQSGASCETVPSMVSVFVYRFDDEENMFVLKKLVQPETYIPSSNKNKDCIVVVFGKPTQTTLLRCGDYPSLGDITQKPELQGSTL